METFVDLTSIFGSDPGGWQGPNFSKYHARTLYMVSSIIKANPRATYTMGGVSIDNQSFLKLYVADVIPTDFSVSVTVEPQIYSFDYLGGDGVVDPARVSVEFGVTKDEANFLLWFHLNSVCELDIANESSIRGVTPVDSMTKYLHLFSHPDVSFSLDGLPVVVKVLAGYKEGLMDSGKVLDSVPIVLIGVTPYIVDVRLGVHRIDVINMDVYRYGDRLYTATENSNYKLNDVRYSFAVDDTLVGEIVRVGECPLRGGGKFLNYEHELDVISTTVSQGMRDKEADLTYRSPYDLRVDYLKKGIDRKGNQCRNTIKFDHIAQGYLDFCHYVLSDYEGGVSIRTLSTATECELLKRFFKPVSILKRDDFPTSFMEYYSDSWIFRAMGAGLGDMHVNYDDKGRYIITSMRDGYGVKLVVNYADIPEYLRESLFRTNANLVTKDQYRAAVREEWSK